MFNTRAGRARSMRWLAALALGASGALAGISPAAAEANITGGSLTWGFKTSFRAYINTGNGNPPIAVSDGATINADGIFTFPSTGGTYDADSGTTNAKYGGKVVFSYPAHMFAITLANPTVVISGGTATLKADVELNTGASPVSVQQANIATLSGTPTSSGSTVTGSNFGATLTAEGATAFNGFYSAGESLDPLSFTFTTGSGGGGTPAGPAVTVTPASGLDPAGTTTITVQGSGFDADANNEAGIYVGFGPKVENHWINSSVLQATKWVNKTNDPGAARDRMNADGSFSTTLQISAVYTDKNNNQVDCTQVQCYVITFAAKGSPDRSQDTFTPITFASSAGGGNTAQQEITAKVNGGPLSLTVAGTSVALPAVDKGEYAKAPLNTVTVSDLRGSGTGWSLVGQVTDFTSAGGGVIAGNYLGWTPSAKVVNDPLGGSGGIVNPGAAAAPGDGLGQARALCTSPAGASNGVFACDAELNLGVPANAEAGDYVATLTLTLS